MKLLDSGRKRKREDEPRALSSTTGATIPFREFEAKLVRKVRELKLPELVRTCEDEHQSSYNMACTRERQCARCSRRRLRDWQSYLKHFKAGMISSKNFLGFYFGQSKHGQRAEMEVRVPSDLLKTGIEIEEMFARFNRFFGPNQEQRCRDCLTNHIFWTQPRYLLERLSRLITLPRMKKSIEFCQRRSVLKFISFLNYDKCFKKYCLWLIQSDTLLQTTLSQHYCGVFRSIFCWSHWETLI